MAGPVHLPQRRRGERLRIEPREQTLYRLAQLASDHLLGDAGRERRYLIGEFSDRAEVGLRQNVRPGSEDLRQLDECGAQLGERAGQTVGAQPMVGLVSPRRATEQNEAPPVAEKRDHQGEQPHEHYEGAHLHRML